MPVLKLLALSSTKSEQIFEHAKTSHHLERDIL